MKRIISNKFLLFLLRILLGFVFIYAGAEKISDPAGFSTSIANYRLLPIFMINFFAITIPWIEIVAGSMLILGISVKENAAIITAMLSVFIIAIGISLIRGLDIECGCFGTGNQIGIQKIIENSFMFIAGWILIYKDSKLFSIKIHSSSE